MSIICELLLIMVFVLWCTLLLSLKYVHCYDMLPSSLLNRTQLCLVNCSQNQTMSDKFTMPVDCMEDHFKICEGFLTIDFNTKLVSYSFKTADGTNTNNENTSLIRADLIANYLPYIKTDITAVRFRQLKMKFSATNPYRLNINYYCRAQIDNCAYKEIETIYPVYVANQRILKSIQPMFYDESILSGTQIECMNDTSNEQFSLCSGYCTLTLGLYTMTKGCNETLSTDALGINMSLGLAYPYHPKFTAQVSSLVLVCNKPKCNSNASVTKVIAIANAFLSAQSIGLRIVYFCPFFLLSISSISLLC